jgi:DNA-binding IclR family transcriptional regulator
MKPESTTDSSSSNSVDHALQVLSMLKETETVRVTDVSARLGVSTSTAHRLLTALRRRGYAQQERTSKAYRVGPALMEFAMLAGPTAQMHSAAHPLLKTLAETLRETVNVMALEGDTVRFVDSWEGDRPVRVSARTGLVLPASATAGGRVLLAGLSDSERSSATSTLPPRLTAETIHRRQDLQEELSEVRRNGYAINLGETLNGLHAIAVGIVSDNTTVAALTVCVPADRGGVSRLKLMLPTLRTYAQNIGERIPSAAADARTS